MTRKKHLILTIPAIAVLALSMSMLPVYATTLIVNDQYYSTGQKYWGNKISPDNGYSGTLGKYYYCRDNNGNAKTGCPTLIDTRTNYVREVTQMAGNKKLSYETTIQGTDPWGNSDTGGGAANHNSNFPRSPTAPSGSNYQLTAQYAWFDSTGFSDSVPSALATNGAVKATLLTDLWFKDTSHTTNFLVIDFALANLQNNNGQWNEQSETIGQGYSSPFVDQDASNNCVYHYSVVVDNNINGIQDTWRQAPTRTINGDIANAFSSSTTYSNTGHTSCTTTIPDGSTYTTNWQMVDLETGVEVYTSTGQVQNYGTIVGAFSQSALQY
ncbi:MAG: hypothetical protein ACREBI_11430 [Nitrosotalea sp.]